MSDTSSQSLAAWCLPPLADGFYLTGPTASGKSPLAMIVAELIGAEIVSMDSMTIYRGMDIGTAKPSLADRERIPHHLLDIADPSESYSVSCYVVEAHRVAQEIRARGKKVLLVGGTPLYLKSLLRGMFLGPPADWEFRNAVEEDVQRFGPQALRDRLEQVDPLSAFRLHPNDMRRMVRALEVARATGQPLSHWQTQFESPSSTELGRVMVLRLERSWLHERINCRVEEMIQRGLRLEVENLVSKYGNLGQTASQGVGYREMLSHIAGELDLPTTIDKIKAHTRQFARRQEIWFRGLQELCPIAVEKNADLESLAHKIAKMFYERL